MQVSTVAATMLWQRSVAASTQGRSSRKDYTCGSTWGFTTRKMFKDKPDVSQTPHHIVCRFFSSFQSWVLTSCFLSLPPARLPLHVSLLLLTSDFRNHLSLVFSRTCPPGSCSVIIITCASVSQLCPLPLIAPVYMQRCHPLIVFLHRGISFPFTSIFLQVGS